MKQKQLVLALTFGLSLLTLGTGCKKEIVERVIETRPSAQIRSGKTIPNVAEGKEGDFYIDLSTYSLYGPKTAAGWGTAVSLKGDKGDPGQNGQAGQRGEKGDKGDPGQNGQDGQRGEKGDKGDKGDPGQNGQAGQRGEKGDKGDKGDPGQTGQAGQRGEKGDKGDRGSKIFGGNGTPSVGLGEIGDWFIDKSGKKLYGPKTAEGWGEPLDLVSPDASSQPSTPTNNSEPEITPDDYTLNGSTLTEWRNKSTKVIDMTQVPELRAITSIEAGAFQKCTALKSVNIPSSVTSIGAIAFYQCSSLTSINIPTSVTSIGEGAFYQCSSLTSINIPTSVTSIGNGAFAECTSLTSIVIPNGVTTIEQATFAACTDLTHVTIPASVSSIGLAAFANCDKLVEVIFRGNNPPSQSNPNPMFSSNVNKIRVPQASVEQYRQAPYLSNVSDRIIGY